MDNKNYWVARCYLLEKTKLRFDRKGIQFAFPQLDLHIEPNELQIGEIGQSTKNAEPMNSDVTAWRYAWKLWQATRAEAETGAPGALYNITVVDDQDKPFRFYSTGDFETYNVSGRHG